MIERLLTTLQSLSALPHEALRTTEGRRLAADCADALRLELDCPQQELSTEQRRILTRLSDLLESEGEIGAAAREALAAIDI